MTPYGHMSTFGEESEEFDNMTEQLKILQQGKNESDLKLKTMEDNIAKILAAIQPTQQTKPNQIQQTSSGAFQYPQ